MDSSVSDDILVNVLNAKVEKQRAALRATHNKISSLSRRVEQLERERAELKRVCARLIDGSDPVNKEVLCSMVSDAGLVRAVLREASGG